MDLEKHKIDLEKPDVSLPSTDSNIEQPNSDYIEESGLRVEKQRMFSHPFSFHGRIRRLEYGLSYIIYLVWYSFASVFSEGDGDGAGAIIYLTTLVPFLWFILAQGCKRCHDRNNSGWYQIIPFYGLWMLFADGDIGENDYGPNPKGKNW